MYVLKHLPGDFRVDEVPQKTWLSVGSFLIVRMTKQEYNTEDAVLAISKALHIKRSQISYAGSKDYHAITSQYLSLRGVQKHSVEALELKDISLECVGFADEPVSLGDLKENHFEILVRNLDPSQTIRELSLVPNIFDVQRFGKNNVAVGLALLKRDYELAIKRICEGGGRQKEILEAELDKDARNRIGALRKIPLKIMKLYVHAVQSKIFNELLGEQLKSSSLVDLKNVSLPLIGFGTDDSAVVQKKLSELGLSQRDFIFREYPDLSSEGTTRPAIVEVGCFERSELEDDECFPDKKKVLVKFSLPKGAYATNVVAHILQSE